MSRWTRPAGGLIALLATGCAAVGPDFQRPAAPAAAGYAMAGDPTSPRAVLAPESRPAGVWWAALGSPDLDTVIRQALRDSPTLAQADAVLARAQAQAAAASGARLPQVDLTAAADRRRINTATLGFSGFPSPTLNLYNVGGTVAYDLDVFGGRRRRVEEAGARVEAEARRADAAYLSLTGEVALAAVRVAALRAELAAVEAAIADDRRVNAMVAAAEQAGGEARSALSNSDAQLARDEALAPPLLRALGEARHRLALLAGQPPVAWAPPEFDLAAFTVPEHTPVSLPSALVRRRPDILAAEADLHAAVAVVGVRTADLYPNLSLRANLAQTAAHPEDLFGYDATGWALGAGLTTPLFHGGTLRAQKRAAEADAQAAMARYQQTVLVAFVQVADALQNLAQSEASVAAFARAEAADAANLRDAETGYRLGGAPLLRVVDAQRNLSNSRRERVRAEGQRLEDVVKLYAAVAADWREAAPVT